MKWKTFSSWQVRTDIECANQLRRSKVQPLVFIDLVLGEVEAGLPSIQLPWQIPAQNETTLTPAELVSDLGIGIVLVPIVSFLQHLAIAKFYACKSVVKSTNSHAPWVNLIYVLLFSRE